jgi:hypothetical protein|tara:strand:+ start:193 stop:387 length:195 start_codon:yes stop_codon:yes gene_type:complete
MKEEEALDKVVKLIDNIGRLLTDCSVNFIESGNDDEEFGALLMLGELQKRIYPILNKIREEITE